MLMAAPPPAAMAFKACSAVVVWATIVPQCCHLSSTNFYKAVAS
jgi:hypothetical protein